MPRLKKPSAKPPPSVGVRAPPPRPKRLAEVHPVLREAARDIREALGLVKGGEASVEGIIALLDALVRVLTQRGLTVSAAGREITVRQGERSVGLRATEQVKRAHRSKPSAFMPHELDRDQEKRSDGLYYYKDGLRAGQPVYIFEATGVLSLNTSAQVRWGPNLTIKTVKWEPRLGETRRELAARVADDVPLIFDCMDRHRARLTRRDHLDAERRDRIDETRAVERRRRVRIEEQDALVDKLMAKATQARGLRQYLAETQAPRNGQEGYARMLAVVSARLTALERDLESDAIEAVIVAARLFPSEDDG